MAVEIVSAHTAELDAATLAAAHGLLEASFDDLAPEDWEHSLGGLHALAWDGDELVGHGALVQRRLLHRERALRTGYVEGMAVHPDRRGEGHGAALMEALERAIHAAYDLGALGSSDEAIGFYAARGWQLWRGPTATLTPTGLRRTPAEDGGIYVLPVSAELDLDGELACDWRDGDVW